MRVAKAFALLCGLAYAKGARSIKDTPGLHFVYIDVHWSAYINPHSERVGEVPAFHTMIEWNGWPAGLLAPDGGVVAAGALANEDSLIAALEAAIAAHPNPSPVEPLCGGLVTDTPFTRHGAGGGLRAKP